jgi:hypothetical protein
MTHYYADAVDAARAKFRSEEADGLNEESLRVHAYAEAALHARGIFDYSADQYAEACESAIEKYGINVRG